MQPQMRADHRALDETDDYGVPPPSYEKVTKQTSAWNPKAWTKKTKIIVGAVLAAIIIIIVIIVGAVVGTQNSNSYPDYSQLSYRLEDTYGGTTFFDDFTFFNAADPTHGFLHYVLEDAATQPAHNLTYASENSAILRVDTSSGEYDTDTGRWSVRVQSKKQYNSGLFIFDVAHFPFGCATWPAIWLSDSSNWPDNGEIDIAEAVNRANTGSQMTLHTSKGCKMNARRKQTGETLASNCLYTANDNQGCGVEGPTESSGEAFNSIGGGIYATEWRDEGIRIWFFPRGNEPDDLSNANTTPDPSTWPEPAADFPSTNCDIGTHFQNASIIMNIGLCGDWAGSEAVYNDEGNCPGTCKDLVANNATAFDNAYWEVNSFKVYSAE